MHRPSGMIIGDIQSVEVVLFIFYLRPGTNAEPGGAKDALDTILSSRNRMQPARILAPTGQRDIDGAGRQFFCKLFAVENIATSL